MVGFPFQNKDNAAKKQKKMASEAVQQIIKPFCFSFFPPKKIVAPGHGHGLRGAALARSITSDRDRFADRANLAMNLAPTGKKQRTLVQILSAFAKNLSPKKVRVHTKIKPTLLGRMFERSS